MKIEKLLPDAATDFSSLVLLILADVLNPEDIAQLKAAAAKLEVAH